MVINSNYLYNQAFWGSTYTQLVPAIKSKLFRHHNIVVEQAFNQDFDDSTGMGQSRY